MILIESTTKCGHSLTRGKLIKTNGRVLLTLIFQSLKGTRYERSLFDNRGGYTKRVNISFRSRRWRGPLAGMKSGSEGKRAWQDDTPYIMPFIEKSRLLWHCVSIWISVRVSLPDFHFFIWNNILIEVQIRIYKPTNNRCSFKYFKLTFTVAWESNLVQLTGHKRKPCPYKSLIPITPITERNKLPTRMPEHLKVTEIVIE